MEFNIIDLTTTPSITTTANSFVINNSLINVDPIVAVADLCWGTILWAFTNVILLICILGGNALTIIAVRTCRRLRCLISNMFICSLAVSDFIVGLSLPYHLAFYLGSNWGRVHELCLIRFFLIIFACCVSILTLIAISIDRYIAIVYPLHYRRYMTRRVAICIIAFNWSIGATVATVPMFWNNWNTAFQCEFDEVLPPWYMAGIITPGFTIIWMLMLFMYWRIMKEASRQAKQLKNPRGKRSSNYLQPDWKSVQIVVFIMGCFSICWLPYFIVACSQIFKIYNITPLLYKATFSLAMTNSALNPVIYAWKNSNFRKAFLRLLHCKSPNCYQTSPEFSKDSPMSQKRCSRNDSPIANKRCSISSADIPINHNNVDECAISGADVEECVINTSTLQIKTERLPKIYTVSMSTTSDCLSMH
ncbi:octopamine receptor beta-3R isoform X1 [Lucilia sericata]|uniref:octopamine receptor beta-3R isoform X1 n=2 Tax=Lucilia sericata TaxID=13632 RepID=UPI0018A842E6|nr:octopamine receptor beta-3R isoform X1 [Lucilia sericata]XP_037824934.1 octopamine receptor beta-3R isoform X1 [Lucilia sericata]